MKKGRILLIDDEVKILLALSGILKDHGFDVFTTNDGSRAAEIIDENEVDIVLLDLVMPSVDGLTVLKSIVERKPAIPVIMLTGHASIQKAVDSIKFGAFDFLEKPVESEKILITIENAMEKTRLIRERSHLLQDVLNRYRMVGISTAIKEIFQLIERIAPADSRVLITGDSGVGKELIARAIHLRSRRGGGPFLAVNCAAIPETLIESELFGYEKGAFTGADRRKKGKFEQASGGTIFLDEIGDMSLSVQAKVLRAIEEGEIERVGGKDPISIDARILAASNKELKQLVREKQFRDDLYFRLSVIDIFVPPLRERKEDIPILIDYFMKGLSEEKKCVLPQLTSSALATLIDYSWPGNVRELRNFIEKIVVLFPAEEISAEKLARLLKLSSLDEPEICAPLTLAEARKKAEKQLLQARLIANNWKYDATAQDLKISRATLFNKLKEFGIKSKNLDYPHKTV